MIKLKELLNQSLIISYFCSNHCKQQYNSEGQFLSTQSRVTIGVYCCARQAALLHGHVGVCRLPPLPFPPPPPPASLQPDVIHR